MIVDICRISCSVVSQVQIKGGLGLDEPCKLPYISLKFEMPLQKITAPILLVFVLSQLCSKPHMHSAKLIGLLKQAIHQRWKPSMVGN